MTTTFRLQSHDGPDLEFEGELIASSTSDDGIKDQWQSFNLYRTTNASKRYVLERLGESRVPGQITMRSFSKLPNAHQVRKRLERRRDNGETYLTIVALDLLEMAAHSDPEFEPELVERL